MALMTEATGICDSAGGVEEVLNATAAAEAQETRVSGFSRLPRELLVSIIATALDLGHVEGFRRQYQRVCRFGVTSKAMCRAAHEVDTDMLAIKYAKGATMIAKRLAAGEMDGKRITKLHLVLFAYGPWAKSKPESKTLLKQITEQAQVLAGVTDHFPNVIEMSLWSPRVSDISSKDMVVPVDDHYYIRYPKRRAADHFLFELTKSPLCRTLKALSLRTQFQDGNAQNAAPDWVSLGTFGSLFRQCTRLESCRIDDCHAAGASTYFSMGPRKQQSSFRFLRTGSYEMINALGRDRDRAANFVLHLGNAKEHRAAPGLCQHKRGLLMPYLEQLSEPDLSFGLDTPMPNLSGVVELHAHRVILRGFPNRVHTPCVGLKTLTSNFCDLGKHDAPARAWLEHFVDCEKMHLGRVERILCSNGDVPADCMPHAGKRIDQLASLLSDATLLPALRELSLAKPLSVRQSRHHTQQATRPAQLALEQVCERRGISLTWTAYEVGY